MAKRTAVIICNDTGMCATVRYDSDLEEYVVEFSDYGVHRPDANYYTTTKDDAIQTAKFTLGILD